MEEHNDALVLISQALGDPLRLLILEHLNGRAATVSEIQAFTGQGQSKVSNHLALLRAAELVEARRQGRQMIYQLKSPDVAELLQAIWRLKGDLSSGRCKSPELLFARTCHDHLAGYVGVAVLKALLNQQALVLIDGSLQVGPTCREVCGRLAIDIDEVRRERRQFLTLCPDCVGGDHLGGALGAALILRMMELGWFTRQGRTRVLDVTAEGTRCLLELLDIDVESLRHDQVLIEE
jgi:DNA-binding transcriptional ArsR family regulator